MKRNLAIGLIIFALLSGGAYLYSYLRLAGPIIIGATSDLSGADDYGRNIQRAINFRVSQINEAGGVNGRSLELIWRDAICTYWDGYRAAEYLVHKKNVPIILGGVCENSAKGIAEITSPKKVVLISPGATSVSLAVEDDYFYRVYPSAAALHWHRAMCRISSQ